MQHAEAAAYEAALRAGQEASASVWAAAGHPAADGPLWQAHQRVRAEAAAASHHASSAAWEAAGGGTHYFTAAPGEVPNSSDIPLFPHGDRNLQETQLLPPSLPGAVQHHAAPRARDRSRSPRTAAEIAEAAMAAAHAAAEDANAEAETEAAAAAALQDAAIAEALRPRIAQPAAEAAPTGADVQPAPDAPAGVHTQPAAAPELH